MTKEKQIEEMAKLIIPRPRAFTCKKIAEALYSAGYRKQREGEWLENEPNRVFMRCSECGNHWRMGYKYCPSCGAKMKVGVEK